MIVENNIVFSIDQIFRVIGREPGAQKDVGKGSSVKHTHIFTYIMFSGTGERCNSPIVLELLCHVPQEPECFGCGT